MSKGKSPGNDKKREKKGGTSTSAYLDSLNDKIEEHYIGGMQALSKHGNKVKVHFPLCVGLHDIEVGNIDDPPHEWKIRPVDPAYVETLKQVML